MSRAAMRAPAALILLTLFATAPALAGGEEPIVCTLKNQEFCGEWGAAKTGGNLIIQDGIWSYEPGDSVYRCVIVEEFRREGRPFSVFECVFFHLFGTSPATYALLSTHRRDDFRYLVFTLCQNRSCVDGVIDEELTGRAFRGTGIEGQSFHGRSPNRRYRGDTGWK